eukprot:scaffold90485_cov70-Attheya_sp.AAC.1
MEDMNTSGAVMEANSIFQDKKKLVVAKMTDEDSLVKMFTGNGKTMPTMLPCASDEEVVMVEFGLRRREASYGGRRGILCKGFWDLLRCPRNIHLRMSNLSRESKVAEPVSPCSRRRRPRAATRLREGVVGGVWVLSSTFRLIHIACDAFHSGLMSPANQHRME